MNNATKRQVGEGDRQSARNYNNATTNFTKQNPDKIKKAGQAAKKAMESPERAELESAERKGASHARGEDPAVKRR